MNNKNKVQETDLQKLSGLLEKLLTVFEEDRAMAKEHYDVLTTQLQAVHDGGDQMTEDAALEKQINVALDLVFKSSQRLEKVIENINKIILTQLSNDSREKIAGIVADAGSGSLSGRVINLQNMIEKN